MKHLRTTSVILALAAAVALPAYAQQQTAKPEESPWAMRAPAAAPQGAPTQSAQQPETGTPAQQELARKVADAMYNKDGPALRQLFAPSALQCIGHANEAFTQDRIKRQLDLPMSKDYKLSVTKLPNNVLKSTKYATYPLPASHLMSFTFKTPGGQTATVNEIVGQEGGKWYEAQPCPTELGLKRFNQMMQKQALGRAEAKTQLSKMSDQLKSQLMTLISKRDTADAWRLCMSELHVDFSTAHEMVAILSGEDSD